MAAALGAKRVGLWGFSQGAWVAPLAAKFSADVATMPGRLRISRRRSTSRGSR
ncbi:MAG TPA: hypothetical protein VGF72_05290 [Gaiellaceae bacterium]